MIVVTAASGQLGRHVVDGLREQGAKFVAGVRNTAVDLGVETRELDYNRPETLEAALQGASTVLLISGSEIGKRVQQHTAVVEAAKKAGVRHIVYTSAPHADTTELVLAPRTTSTRSSSVPRPARSSAPPVTAASPPRRARTSPTPRSLCSPSRATRTRSTN